MRCINIENTSQMAQKCDSRDRRVNKLNMSLQVGGDRISEGPDGCVTSVEVLEYGELGIKQVAGLADGDLERQPITSRRDGFGSDIVLLQPCTNGGNGLGRGSNECLDLRNRMMLAHVCERC